MSPSENQRKDARGKVSFAVTYGVKSPLEARVAFGEIEREGIAEDLSAGGLSLLTAHLIPVGAEVSIKFRAVDGMAPVEEESGSHKFELLGEACYCRHTADNFSFRTGIRFKKISDRQKMFINACVMGRK